MNQNEFNAQDVRLLRAMAKMRKGKPVVVAALGGSITTGYASDPIDKKSWAAQVGAWWLRTGKKCGSQVTFLNEGVSGTDSAFASVRVGEHIIKNKADVVILEFAMNDQWLQREVRKRSYEGVLRQLLDGSDRAVLALFVNERDGNQPSNQREQKKICAHYGVPFVSWKDEANAEFGGKPDWKSWFSEAETVHPDNAGHAKIASYLISRLESLWSALPQKDSVIPSVDRTLPKPLFGTDYQYAQLVTSANAEVVSNTGWYEESPRHGEWVKHGGATPGWSTAAVGAELVVKVRGTSVNVLYSESDQFRDAKAWVEYAGGKAEKAVMLKCYSAMRTGYLGWASRELADAHGKEKTFYVHIKCSLSAKKEFAGREANVVGIVVTHAKPTA